MEELLSLKWNNHRTTFLHILAVLRDKQLYTDATLACDGKIYPVHKLVLSTCSDYFSAMLDRTSCKNPIIVLKDIKSEDLEALLDYMYLGEVNVRQSDLSTLIKAAECLRVKGLAVADDEPPPRKSRTSDNQTRRGDTSGSPPAKRKRRSDVEDGRDDVRPSKLENRHSSPVHSSAPSRPKTPNNSHTSSTTVRNNSNNSHSSTNNTNNSVGLISNSTSNIKASSDGLAVTNAVGEMLETVPCVKVEMEEDEHDVITGGGGDGSNALGDNAGDSNTGDMGDNFNLSSEDFKEEDDNDGGDLGTDLPEFLQQATANYSHSSFAGTSFQPDLSWQGSGDSGGAGSGMAGNFGATAGLSFGSSQQQDGHSSTAGGTGAGGSRTFLAIRGQGLDAPSTPSQAWLLEHASATEDALVCKYCGKIFAGRNRQQRMQFHALTHTGEKPHPCPYCPYRARLKYNLKKHVRTMHRDLLANWITEPDLSTANGDSAGMQLAALERYAATNNLVEDTPASLLPGVGMLGAGVAVTSSTVGVNNTFGGVSDQLLRGVWGGVVDNKELEQDSGDGVLQGWDAAPVSATPQAGEQQCTTTERSGVYSPTPH